VSRLLIGASVTLALVTGYALGVRNEANTHALQVSRITGTPYSQVLDAWARLQASTMTDTDCQEFDDAVGLDAAQNKGA